MDNRRDLPGYKYYARPDGYRPAVYVTFLDLVEAAGAPANGVCLPVTDSELEGLDERERNYRRIDVSDRIAGGARVWTYIGSPEGRERRERGVALATAVIDAGYLSAVHAGFAALGRDEAAVAARSLAPRDLPVVQLVRHELS
ncbi:MAG: gamma-glutamylcyclotransferase family protein [Solirubrobacteraceae bacterium]